MFLYSEITQRTQPLKQRREELHKIGWRLPQHLCECSLCQNDGALNRKIADMSIVDKIKEIFLKPSKETQREVNDFEKDAIEYLHENDGNHPSFNTLAVQNCLYLFWHLFPDLV